MASELAGPSGGSKLFLAECYWPGVTEQDARTAVDRIDRLGVDDGRQLRGLSCLLMVDDGVVFFLYEAVSPDDVRRAHRRVGVDPDRIVAAIEIREGVR
jgi:hypothetical protein